jgi:hypothetical protein
MRSPARLASGYSSKSGNEAGSRSTHEVSRRLPPGRHGFPGNRFVKLEKLQTQHTRSAARRQPTVSAPARRLLVGLGRMRDGLRRRRCAGRCRRVPPRGGSRPTPGGGCTSCRSAARRQPTVSAPARRLLVGLGRMRDGLRRRRCAGRYLRVPPRGGSRPTPGGGSISRRSAARRQPTDSSPRLWLAAAPCLAQRVRSKFMHRTCLE